MREPFDYDAALERLAGNQEKIGPWRKAAAVLGDALAAQGGGTPWAMQNIGAQRSNQAQRMQDAVEKLTAWRREDWVRQNEEDLRASAPFSSGRDRVQYDPRTGQSQVIHDGVEDFELYARELGLEPGSPEYFAAVEDYVLRSAGPSAHERDLELDDHQTGNDEHLEGVRYGNRVTLENLRQSNRAGLEGMRQGNRVQLRNTPRPSSRRSSAGGDLPLVSSPAEARRLPSGTRFRTPNGQVKVVP